MKTQNTIGNKIADVIAKTFVTTLVLSTIITCVYFTFQLFLMNLNR